LFLVTSSINITSNNDIYPGTDLIGKPPTVCNKTAKIGDPQTELGVICYLCNALHNIIALCGRKVKYNKIHTKTSNITEVTFLINVTC